MYKVASDRRQRALHRGCLADWQNGVEILSPEDKIKQLQEGCKILEQRIQAIPTRNAKRRELGRQKHELSMELHELKAAQKRAIPLEWKSFFVNEAKRILSESQWEMIYRAAIHECEIASRRLGRPVQTEDTD